MSRQLLFLPTVLLGGLVFGLGLGVSHMARPEVVLSFLHGRDLGLLFVLLVGAAVAGTGFALFSRLAERAPLTGDPFGTRRRTLDRNVLFGGVLFGAGWGLSGMCPGAAFASLGVGNLPILWGVAGMFVGAYAQAYWRSALGGSTGQAAAAD